MNLTAHLPAERRTHVEARLAANQIAWLTTVRPSGQPESVPVWFYVGDGDTILMYSEPGKAKVRNISENPRVTMVLDATDIGRDVIRIEGTAARSNDYPAADQVPGYAAKYMERIATMFGSAAHFAELYSVPILITPSKLYA